MTERASSPPAAPRGAVQEQGASLYGASVEYAIHCLVWLIEPREKPPSSRDLADLQGVSASVVAKILPKLEKAGVVASSGGISGGYRLARPPGDITVLDIVEAVDGRKRVFDCKDIRNNCILFGDAPPTWISRGVCGVHAVMLRAEKAMQAEMARTSLLDLAVAFGARIPEGFSGEVDQWFVARGAAREHARVSAVRRSSQKRTADV